jgi:hypothetical protein
MIYVPAASTGQTPPGQTPPGQTTPGQTPPGQTPPGQTPPGQAPAGKHCVVPNLKGASLNTATHELTAAGCSLGKVTRPKTRKHQRAPKNLVVVAQRAAAGSQLGGGSAVAITLGPAPKGKAPQKHT